MTRGKSFLESTLTRNLNANGVAMGARPLIVAVAFAFATLGALPHTTGTTPLLIGTSQPANITATVGVAREDSLKYVGSTFISVKFEDFDLPVGDEVTVKSSDGSVAFTYTGKGRASTGAFYSSQIPGDEAIVQYTSHARVVPGSYAYRIPIFTRSILKQSIQSTCGLDESVPAKCYATGTELSARLPLAYERAQAVARLTIPNWEGVAGQTARCTGWLVGSEGHLITNNHCVDSQSVADMIDFEFELESASCEEQCRMVRGCGRSRLVATSATFITTNSSRDYTLLKLPVTANIKKYGYLQLRGSGAVMNESIYIPQHPRGYSKRISAVYAGGVDASITAIDYSGEDSSPNAIGYNADTEPGSSGSPVLAKSDNSVVGLHNVGGCYYNSNGSSTTSNHGIDVRYIISDLQSKGITVEDLIADGPSSSTTEPPTPAPPTPSAGQCSDLSAQECDATFFCAWDALKKACQRWWPSSSMTEPPTAGPTTPTPGQCSSLSTEECDATFFCAWDTFKNACQRWW